MSNKKAKGKRAKTRDKFKRHGEKVSVSKLLQNIPKGTRVEININSSVHSAMPARRFQGATAVVTAERGKAFCVNVASGGKAKELVVHPAHLKVLSEKLSEKTQGGEKE